MRLRNILCMGGRFPRFFVRRNLSGEFPTRRLYEEDLPNDIGARRKGGLVEFTSGPVSILSIATSTSADRISAEVCVYLRFA